MSTSPSDQTPTIPPPGRSRPTLLRPPATIVSPPSPVDTTSAIPQFTSPVSSPLSSPPEGPDETTYDSPESDEDDGTNTLSPVTSRIRPRADSHTSHTSRGSSSNRPIAATQMSTSPSWEPSLLTPHTPGSPALSPSLSSEDGRFGLPPRAPSPSSPHYRPKPSHHRRTSSTHRVRETLHAEQKSTEDGSRMVNNYRLGRSLGSGAYAKVELAVDVSTGQEYVSHKPLPIIPTHDSRHVQTVAWVDIPLAARSTGLVEAQTPVRFIVPLAPLFISFAISVQDETNVLNQELEADTYRR